MNFKSDSIEKKLNTTKAELLKISKDYDKQKVENESLSIGFKQLESELISLKKENAKLKLDSLTKNRFKHIDKERVISINNKPLVLFPFEIFEIMTFEGLSNTGLTESLDFKVQGSGEGMSFYGENNKFEFDSSKWKYNPDITIDKVVVLLKCDSGILRRVLIKNKSYKVIYCYHSDSVLWRQPYPSCNNDGYYIVDILELNQPFEREKEWRN